MFRSFIALAAILLACLLIAVFARPAAVDLRLALATAAVVVALAVLAVAKLLRATPRQALTAVLLMLGLIPLAACATPVQQQLLNNLSSDCERHYDGSVSAGLTGGGFTGTVKIDCAPKASPASTAAAAP